MTSSSTELSAVDKGDDKGKFHSCLLELHGVEFIVAKTTPRRKDSILPRNNVVTVLQ